MQFGRLLLLGAIVYGLYAYYQQHTSGVMATNTSSTEQDLEVRESHLYYQIAGENTSDLRKQMHTLGPVDETGRHCDAYTDWHVAWHYSYSRANGQCAADDIKTTLTVNYLYPQLKEPEKSTPTEWERFLDALTTHENGHKDIGLETAREITKTLATLPAQESCEVLKRIADASTERILSEAKLKERIYDQETDHGATQGARLQ